MQLGLRPRGILSLLGTLHPIEHSRSLSNPYIKTLQSQDDNFKFLLSITLGIYLTDREIILLRGRVVARKHQTVGQSKVFNTQIGKCHPILEENKIVE